MRGATRSAPSTPRRARVGVRRAVEITLLGATVAACVPDLTVAEDALIACAGAGDCPPGHSCRADVSLCVASERSGEPPPAFVGSVAMGPPRVSAHPGFDLFTVSFALDAEVPPRPPYLEVTVGGDPIACAREDAPEGVGYLCTLTVEATDPEGERAVHVVARSLSLASATSDGSVTVDHSPPRVLSAFVLYEPALGRPLPSAARATADTTIRVLVSADEPITEDTSPVMTASDGTHTISFAVDEQAGAAVTFVGVPPAGAGDATYVPLITWEDTAGNAGEAVFSSPTLDVKTSRPDLLIDQSEVTFLRSPTGRGVDEDLGDAVVPAGRYFALAPADPLSGSATLPSTAFQLAGGVAPTLVRLWADPDGELLLGAVAPDASDGTWPRLRLLPIDSPRLYATGVDDAANESAPVRIDNAEWVGTPLGVPSEIPHALIGVPYADSLLEAAAAGNVPLALERGLAAVEQVGAPAWRRLLPTAATPAARFGHGITYDPARGRTVLFGGSIDYPVFDIFSDLWEWDGFVWRPIEPDGETPEARASPALVYDGGRGRVLLFGGLTSVPMDDTWEWDGVAWSERTTSSRRPPPRTNHAMAYDSARRRVVLFGGSEEQGANLGDHWEWDGREWDEVQTEPLPGRRHQFGMAYDESRGTTVMFGGCGPSSTFGCTTRLDELWELGPEGWSPITFSPPAPEPRSSPAMVYDPIRRAVLLFGGRTAAGYVTDLWAWDGEAWTLLEASVPFGTPRAVRVAAFDAARGALVAFGGNAGGTTDIFGDLWEWRSDRWIDATPATAWPPEREGAALVRDAVNDRLLLYGGRGADGQALDDLWEWDGVRWERRCDGVPPTDACDPSPPSLADAAYGFDDERGVFVVFGGCPSFDAAGDCPSYSNELWEWDGAAWSLGCDEAGSLCPDAPATTLGPAMAFHPASGRLVLATSGALLMFETWEWDGAVWTQRCDGQPTGDSCATVAQRVGHRMTTDTGSGDVVMFGGGLADQSFTGELWRWNGSDWTLAAGPTPPGRLAAPIAYDEARERLVTYGGLTGASFDSLSDETWEWAPSGWLDRTPAAALPGKRWKSNLAYSSLHQSALLFGGFEGFTTRDDFWRWDAAVTRRPGIQLDLAVSGVTAAQVQRARIRAWCGGAGAGAAGAVLEAWARGAWRELRTVPALPEAPALLDWTAPSAAEAADLLGERDRRASIRCLPTASTGADAAEARVALEHAEVRLRYTTTD